MVATNYYIFITKHGRVPVKTKIKIKSLAIANCFYEDVYNFFPVDFFHYLLEGGN